MRFANCAALAVIIVHYINYKYLYSLNKKSPMFYKMKSVISEVGTKRNLEDFD